MRCANYSAGGKYDLYHKRIAEPPVDYVTVIDKGKNGGMEISVAGLMEKGGGRNSDFFPSPDMDPDRNIY